MIADPLYPECIIYTVQKNGIGSIRIMRILSTGDRVLPTEVANFQKDLAKSVSFNRQSHQ